MRLGNNGHTGAELYGAMDRKDTEARKILFFMPGIQDLSPSNISGARLDLHSRKLEMRGSNHRILQRTAREPHHGVPQRTRPLSEGTMTTKQDKGH